MLLKAGVILKRALPICGLEITLDRQVVSSSDFQLRRYVAVELWDEK
jgi:hypothetical protein